jgi:hypothetical protein
MADANHTFGSDLVLGANGDLSTVTGVLMGQQRILRRLLTNPGDYLWEPTYGGGLGQLIGQNVNPAQIVAVIQAQLGLEAGIAQSPPPVITVQPITNGMYVEIDYTSTVTNLPTTLAFSVTP